MSIGSFFKSLGHLFSGHNLSAAEKYVSDMLPVVGDDIAAFSATLPATHDSLFATAAQAQKLVADVKGQHISLSLATHLAQAVLTAKWPQIAAEAEALLSAA